MFTLNELLIFAARSGNLQLMRERLTAGAEVSYYDERRGSALFAAIASHQLSAVELLLSHGAKVRMTDAHGDGPLEYALYHQDDCITAVLLASGARLQSHSRPHFRAQLAEHLKRHRATRETPTIGSSR